MNATIACMLMWTHGWKNEPVRLELKIEVVKLHTPHTLFHLDHFAFQHNIIEDIADNALCDDNVSCLTKVVKCY